ncbi:HAD family hydrolase [Candidatus Woesearchaeota archaeon]|nr:HAD family hydrolase [Candidatus Woesearchaeota archaeon]
MDKMIVCFDLDGTLVDTEAWIKKSEKLAFKKNGIKVTNKELYSVWGLNLTTQIKTLYPELKQKEINKIKKDFEEIRNEKIDLIKPFKNTKRILTNLSKKYTLCLLSNNSHKKIELILKQTKIDKKLFKLIIGDDEVKRAKPFPDEIYKVEKKLKKKVKFMVGDTVQDIKTAKAAKVKSIIIKTGPKQTWKTLNNADFIIKDIKELPKLIKEVQK